MYSNFIKNYLGFSVDKLIKHYFLYKVMLHKFCSDTSARVILKNIAAYHVTPRHGGPLPNPLIQGDTVLLEFLFF